MHLPLLILLISFICLIRIKKWWFIAPLGLSLGFAINVTHIPPKALPQNTDIFIGYVSSFPDIRLDHQKIQIQTDHETLLIHLKRDFIVRYGDQLKIKGKAFKPPKIKHFNYQKYLERFGITRIIKAPQEVHIVCQSCAGSFITRKASEVRSWMGTNLKNTLPSPHRDLAMGILLGIKKELPPETKLNFKDSGLQHLLVVSGSNIAIVMLCFQIVFKRLGPLLSMGLSISGIIFFVLMAGGDPPVVRAALMGSVAGLSLIRGRTFDTTNALLLSACIIGLYNPLVIQVDLGFWLSFAATLGIITFSPWLQLKMAFITMPQIIKDMAIISLSAQIGVLPMLLIFFGTFPLGALVANLVTEPIMPWLMLGSTILGLLGWLSISFLWPVKVLTYLGFQILIKTSSWFATLPSIEVPKAVGYILLGMLIGLTLVLTLHPRLSEIHLAKDTK